MTISRFMLAATALVAATGASAQTTSSSQIIELSRSPSGANQVAYFDSNLGTLQSVNFVYNYSNVGSFQIGNGDSTTATGNVQYQSFIDPGVNTTALGGLSIFSRSMQDYGSQTFQPGETKLFLVDAFLNSSFTDTSASDLQALSNAGGGLSAVAPFIAFTVSTPLIQNEQLNTRTVLGGGSLTVTYNYLAATVQGAVPEPAAWAMMIVGVGGIGGVMRRRRTSARVAIA